MNSTPESFDNKYWTERLAFVQTGVDQFRQAMDKVGPKAARDLLGRVQENNEEVRGIVAVATRLKPLFFIESSMQDYLGLLAHLQKFIAEFQIIGNAVYNTAALTKQIGKYIDPHFPEYCEDDPHTLIAILESINLKIVGVSDETIFRAGLALGYPKLFVKQFIVLNNGRGTYEMKKTTLFGYTYAHLGIDLYARDQEQLMAASGFTEYWHNLTSIPMVDKRLPKCKLTNRLAPNLRQMPTLEPPHISPKFGGINLQAHHMHLWECGILAATDYRQFPPTSEREPTSAFHNDDLEIVALPSWLGKLRLSNFNEEIEDAIHHGQCPGEIVPLTLQDTYRVLTNSFSRHDIGVTTDGYLYCHHRRLSSMNIEQTNVYDQSGRLIRKIESMGRTTDYAYDDLGRLIGTREVFETTNGPRIFLLEFYRYSGKVRHKTWKCIFYPEGCFPTHPNSPHVLGVNEDVEKYGKYFPEIYKFLGANWKLDPLAALPT